MNAVVGNLHLPSLPYSKTDCVADLDAARPAKKPPKPKPAVPASKCALSESCGLRKAAKCSPMYCYDAAQYVANAEAHVRADKGGS